MYKIIISKNAVKDMAHLPVKVTIQISNGRYYVGAVLFTPSGGGTDGTLPARVLMPYYRSPINVWNIGTPITTIDNLNYNPSGSLISIPADNYVKHSLYIVGDGLNEQYFFVYGQHVN